MKFLETVFNFVYWFISIPHLLVTNQILNKKAIEASDNERPIPDLRTGDVVEIKLVYFSIHLNLLVCIMT